MRDRIKGSIADGSWRELKERLRLRSTDPENGEPTLDEFSETCVEEYAKVRNRKMTWKRKVTSLNALIPHLGGSLLSSISHADVDCYIKKRQQQERVEGTINKELNTLRHLLSFAVKRGVMPLNPLEDFPNLDEDHKAQPRFAESQINAVLSAIRFDCRPVFVFIKEKGCRREEALSLQHWQVHIRSRQVVFSHNTKSRRYRYVPLTEEAMAAIMALPRLDECPYVFYNPNTHDRWSDCRKPWIRAREKAGVPGLRVNDLRTHCAIKLAESGAVMHDIQSVLGHASVTTTERHCAQFSPEHSSKKILRVLQGGNITETSTELRGRTA